VFERGDGLKRLLAQVVLLNISPKNHKTKTCIFRSFQEKRGKLRRKYPLLKCTGESIQSGNFLKGKWVAK
jgi:hypothetical protein